MRHRLTETPINSEVRMGLRIILIPLVVILFVGKDTGYVKTLNDWIEIHVPAWLAIADLIAVSLFPVVALQMPLESEAHYLVGVLFLPFLLIAGPCSKKAPGYLSTLAFLGFVYFVIRRTFFNDSLPRLKKSDDWDAKTPLLGGKDDRWLKIFVVLTLSGFFLIKILTAVFPMPLWWAFIDIAALCTGAIVISRAGMKSPGMVIGVFLASIAISNIRPSLEAIFRHPVGIWIPLAAIILYCAAISIVRWRRVRSGHRDIRQNLKTREDREGS